MTLFQGNLADQEVPDVSKSKFLYNKPVKLSQKQLGDISKTVDKQLKRRSEGICELQEKCTGAFAIQRAHITARGKLTAKTTVNDLLHVCLDCHIWMDREPAGIEFKRKLLREGA
jgi:hypothetical protein